GMMVVQTAQAAEITQVPDLENQGINGAGAVGPQWNARIAIAPYAQVVADNSYTFIGISHPSLATAHTSIGVVVEALGMTTVPNTASGRAAVFTVSAGETHRVFVVNQSHATINLNNSAFTDTQTHLITTTDALQAGNIKVWSVGTNPTNSTFDTHRPGRYIDALGPGAISRFDNLAQLSMWGVVYQTSNGAGFALEFIGDMHDSSVSGAILNYSANGHSVYKDNTSGYGRGVN
ncbi:uncharacterized protein METZ01_LOCUS131662, partial [marine metagenome]